MTRRRARLAPDDLAALPVIHEYVNTLSSHIAHGTPIPHLDGGDDVDFTAVARTAAGTRGAKRKSQEQVTKPLIFFILGTLHSTYTSPQKYTRR